MNTWHRIADAWVASLMLQYLVAAALYSAAAQPWKTVYFLSAAGISLAVLRMR